MELRPIQTALLAGRAASRWTSSATPAMPSLHRQFATTRAFLAESGTAASAPAPSMVAWKKNFEEQRQQKQQQRQQDPASRQAGGARSSTNIYSFLSQKPNSSPGASSSSSPTGMGKGSSLDTPWAQPSRTRRGSGSDSGLRNNKNSSNLIEDLGIFADLNSAPRPALDDFAAAHQHKKESIMDVKLRLRPSIGRTVHCGKGSKVDLARGLQLLNTQVRRNKVSQDLSRQRFHERPGLKRKRLRRERWRARFKDGFKATCGRVRELARQGW